MLIKKDEIDRERERERERWINAVGGVVCLKCLIMMDSIIEPQISCRFSGAVALVPLPLSQIEFVRVCMCVQQ